MPAILMYVIPTSYCELFFPKYSLQPLNFSYTVWSSSLQASPSPLPTPQHFFNVLHHGIYFRKTQNHKFRKKKLAVVKVGLKLSKTKKKNKFPSTRLNSLQSKCLNDNVLCNLKKLIVQFLFLVLFFVCLIGIPCLTILWNIRCGVSADNLRLLCRHQNIFFPSLVLMDVSLHDQFDCHFLRLRESLF